MNVLSLHTHYSGTLTCMALLWLHQKATSSSMAQFKFQLSFSTDLQQWICLVGNLTILEMHQHHEKPSFYQLDSFFLKPCWHIKTIVLFQFCQLFDHSIPCQLVARGVKWPGMQLKLCQVRRGKEKRMSIKYRKHYPYNSSTFFRL